MSDCVRLSLTVAPKDASPFSAMFSLLNSVYIRIQTFFSISLKLFRLRCQQKTAHKFRLISYLYTVCLHTNPIINAKMLIEDKKP